MAEFSFEDLQAAQPQEFSFDELKKPQEFTFDEVTKAAPTPTMAGYAKETGQRLAQGAIETAVATPLRGYGAISAQAGTALDPAMVGIDMGAGPTEDRSATIKDNPAYKAGLAVSDWSSKLGPKQGQELLSPFATKLATGIGSVGGNFASALVPGLGTTSPVLAGIGESTDEAVKQGATDDQIRAAAPGGGFAGATDLLDFMIPGLGALGATSLIKRVGVRALEGFVVEGGQEGLQQLIQNINAYLVYNPKKDIWEEVQDSAEVGGAVGAIMAALLGGHGHAKVKPNVDEKPTDNALPVQQSVPTSEAQPIPGFETPMQTALKATFDPRPAMQVTDSPVPFMSSPVDETEGRGGVSIQTAPETTTSPGAEKVLTPETVPQGETPAPAVPEAKTKPTGVWWGENLEAGRKAVEDETLAIINRYREGIGQPALDRVTNQTPISLESDPVVIDSPQQQLNFDFQPQTELRATPALIDGQVPVTINPIGEGPRFEVVGDVGPITEEGPTHNWTVHESREGSTVIIPALHAASAREWMNSVVPTNGELNGSILNGLKGKLLEVLHPDTMVYIMPSKAFYSGEWSGTGRPINPGVKGVQVSFNPSAPIDSPRANRINNNAILIPASTILSADARTVSHIITHEIVHAATVEMLEHPTRTKFKENVRSIMEETQKKLNNLVEDGLLTRDEMDKALYYSPFQNEKEFVAEALSNPWFQELLGNIRIGRELQKRLGVEGRPSLWGLMVQQIQRILGVPKGMEYYSMLEAVLRTSDKIMDAQRRLPTMVDMAPYVAGVRENKAALSQESRSLNAVAYQPETAAIRTSMNAVFNGNVPYQIKQAGAHADRMAWLYKYAASLSQLARANPRFTPLLRYMETVFKADRISTQLIDAAVRVSKDWQHLGKRGLNLAHYIDELGHMMYRSPQEIAQGIVRHPSPQEDAALRAKYKLGPEEIALYNRVSTAINGIRDLIGNAMMQVVNRNPNLSPSQKMSRIGQIQVQMQALRGRPYFPFTNFGRHYIVVKDPAGRLLRFETVERRGFRSATRVHEARFSEIHRAWQRQYGRAPVHGKDIIAGVLPEHTLPFIGLPVPLLQQASEMLDLTPEQINIAQYQIQAQALGETPWLTPRSQKSFYVPGYGLNIEGYSTDLLRSFARHTFYASRYLAKVQHMDELKAWITQARQFGGRKETEIANFMEDHRKNTFADGKGEWGHLKGAIFFWALGASPAAAFINGTQTPLFTFPFLGAKFGTRRTATAMTKVMQERRNFYRKGSYQNQTAFEMKAIDYGIKTGRITETQASEIAGFSQHSLLNSLGLNRVQRVWTGVLKGSSFMFEMVEQWNRRVAFTATLRLATQNPNAKYVQYAVKLHNIEYNDLIAKGFTPSEAASLVTAIDATDQTQFNYAKVDRPRFMRGPVGSLLTVFKRYIHGVAGLLLHNPDMWIRYFLVSMFLGGLNGSLPGWDDMKGILKALAWQLLGRDFDLEQEVRQYVISMFDGKIDPDLVLHGVSRKSFGAAAVLDLLGSFFSGNPGRGLEAPKYGAAGKSGFGQTVPFPSLDLSRSIGTGNILPIDAGKTFGPAAQEDINQSISQTTQRASGAFFSTAFNIYKAAVGSKLPANDWKRWENAMPRSIAAVSSSFRSYNEGRERSTGGPQGGATLVPYDVRDTEQFAELVAKGLGFTPERESAQRDLTMAQLEASKFLMLQKQTLMGNFYEALAGGNSEEIDRVNEAIRTFNGDLPDYMKSEAITSKALMSSMKGHVRGRVAKESGVPVQKKMTPAYREIEKLYPGATVDVRVAR